MDLMRDLSARPSARRQWQPARLLLLVGVIAVAATLPWGVARARSVCARWCVANFPPGPTRRQCIRAAAHGAGPCYDCGPLGNNAGLCGGICCPAGDTCSAAGGCVAPPMECGVVSGDPNAGTAMCGGRCPLDFPFCEFVPGTAGGRCTCVDHECGTAGVACSDNFCPGQAEACTALAANGGCACAPCTSLSQPLKTGQTTPFGPGSDGDVQAGHARSYTDNGDGTITDNATGLMWEKKDQSGGVHDSSNEYTWCGASCGSTYFMDGTITTTFLATLNAGTGFAGHTDWRVPNVNELATLVNRGNVNPTTDPAFNTNCAPGCTVLTCSCTPEGSGGLMGQGDYWSSTTLADDPSFAWELEIDLGILEGDAKFLPQSPLFPQNVRAVRDGNLVCHPSQPLKTGQTTAYGSGSDGDLQTGHARSYTDNGDGTITDNATGLMWEKKDQSGGIHDRSNQYTWCAASCPSMNGTITTTFLAGLNAGAGFAGHTDWRIPNENELQTLVNYGNHNPAVDTVFDTNCAPGCTVLTCSCTVGGGYWSSTEDPAGAWDVDLGHGQADPISNPQTFVRAVRGGL